jgi:ABC-type amino acid transport substrate-binding protein
VVTAELASARIAQGQINSLTQLHGQKVAYSQFNEQVKLLVTQFFAVPKPVPSIAAAVNAVNQGTAAAAFINLIELRCHALDNPSLEFNLSTSRISLGYYAMAVPQGSDLTGKINQALYFMNQQGTLKSLEKSCG